MSNIIELPPLEKWDSNNEWLYHYYEIKNDDGSSDLGIYKMPFPIPQVFYRRRKIPSNMLNAPQYDKCKYCGEPLTDGYWRRMGCCRKCNEKQPWAKPLFQCDSHKEIKVQLDD